MVPSQTDVLATGGADRLFKLNLNPPDVTGDGYASVYPSKLSGSGFNVPG